MPEGYNGNAIVIGEKIHAIYTKTEYVYEDGGIITDFIQNNLLYIYDFNGTVIDIINLDFSTINNKDGNIIPSNDDAFYFVRERMICKITYTGTVLWELAYRIELNSNIINPGVAAFVDYATDCIYIAKPEGIYVINTIAGELINYFSTDFEVLYITKSHDEKIILKTYSDTWLYDGNRYKYYAVNMKSEKLNEYKLPDTFTHYSNTYGEVYYGSSFADDYEIYYKDDYGLYGYNSSNTKSELLVNWTNSDLLGRDCTVLSIIMPDVILCELEDIYFQSKWYAKAPKSLALLMRIPDDELEQKTILTIASVNSSLSGTFTQAVVMFNRQSEKYRVVIDDYSIYNTTDDITKSSTFFNLDVISGVVHDMVFINPLTSIPLDSYINKGMFVDLYELFDKDPDISRDYLLGCIKRNNETDEHLYMIPSYFTIYTLVGKPSTVGTNETFTIAEIIELNENLPTNTTLFTNCGRTDILKMFLFAGAIDYMDYENAKCNFIDSNFINMIEFVKVLPDNIGNGWYYFDFANEEIIEKVRNENSYLLEFALLNIESFINLKYIYGDKNYVIKGYPNQTGNGSIINNFDFFTINSKSLNKEGAWEFLKFYLSDEIQLFQNTLPITNSALSFILDKYLSKYFYTDKTYIDTMALHILDEPMEQWRLEYFDDFYFTEADAIEIKRFLNDVPVVPKYDNTVFEIIYEEISAFFANAITAEQCAGYIQNRVSTYLNERK